MTAQKTMVSTMTKRPLLFGLVALGLATSVANGFVPMSKSIKNRIEGRAQAVALFALMPTLDQWKLRKDGSVVGTVTGHKKLKDGAMIQTSPLRDSSQVEKDALVRTVSGSSYKLGRPAAFVPIGGAVLVRSTRSTETLAASFPFSSHHMIVLIHYSEFIGIRCCRLRAVLQQRHLNY